jgi:outer membrane protein assembly factor BamE (lipoprotein component of BamABCDE complex)
MVLGLLAGCASTRHTSGRAISDEKVGQIVKGKTTIDDVISLFGAPTTQSEMAGSILYTYRHSVSTGKTAFFPYVTSSDSVEEADELTITFDKTTGTVKTYSLQRGIERKGK